MPDPRIPKYRVPAALISPASLCLIGGVVWFFSQDYGTEEEMESNIQREFPQVVRTSHEVDDRMKEFFRRVNNNDPREEERLRNLLNKGKGSRYGVKRHHATQKEIEDFGFVPKTPSPQQDQPSSSSPSEAMVAPLVDSTANKASPDARTADDAALPPASTDKSERKSGRKGWLW